MTDIADLVPGAVYSLPDHPDHRFAVYMDDGIWTVLVRAHDEYSLRQIVGLGKYETAPAAYCGLGWSGSFDGLCALHGLDTTWSAEVARYRREGFARARSVDLSKRSSSAIA